MTVLSVLDAAGRRRSPATLPGYHAGRPPRYKGIRYPADGRPDRVGHAPHVRRPARLARASNDRRLWRARLRIQEALALSEHDLDHRRGSIPRLIAGTDRTQIDGRRPAVEYCG